jgi:flagellar biosynthesis protein FlhA
VEFTVFPTVLLATTLFRLVLNVSATRLILTNAAEHGEYAAGHVIRTFGTIVAGNNVVLGMVLFVIFVVIQFVVINRGSVRTSEVAARFALDGMPGRQMAIDADLNAGVIDEKESRRRRDEITRQADFYGAMDGASKFVRGDAIASVVITLINILGGLSIGTLYYGMELARAADVFAKLTIGDGLVSQVPAFLLSTAAGILVTRQSREMDLGRQVASQLFAANPQTLYISGGFVTLLALTGLFGIGSVPLGVIGASAIAAAYLFQESTKREILRAAEAEKKQRLPERPKERIEDALRLDALELDVGYGLIPLADKRKGGDLEERIVLIRRQLAHELGMILPGVRLRDNPNLAPNDYDIRLKGATVAKGTVFPGHFLAIATGATTGELRGIKTKEPLFGQAAYWIDAGQRERAEMFGYTVVEASHVLTTHLTETIRRHAPELLNRERVSALINALKETSPQVVSEVVPEIMKLGEIQRVLQNLLREGVSIRDLESIVETLGDYAPKTKDPDILTEYVRHRLSRTLCQQYRDANSALKVVTLDPALEDMLAAGIEHVDRLTIKLSPTVIDGVARAIVDEAKKLINEGRPPVVLVGPAVRAGLKQMMMAALPNLAVLSYNEITRDTRIESVGMVNYVPTSRPLAAGSRA